MPAVIPTYEPGPAADTQPRVHVPFATGASPVGQGLMDLGHGLGILDQGMQKQADERAKVWAGQQAGLTMLSETQALDEAQRQAPPGADGFAKGYLEGFDKRAAEASATAPDAASKRYLQQHLLAQRTHLGAAAMDFQFKAGDADAVNRFTQSVDTWGKLAQQTPEQYQAAMNVLGQTMPDVVPQVRQKLIDHATTTLTNAAASGALDRNPYTVQDATGKALGENGFKGPTGVPWVDAASPEQVRTWNNAAQVKIKQIEAALKATNDHRDSHTDGAVAFQSVVGSPGTPGTLPRNIGAPDLPAYQQKDIDRVSAFVKNPSPYDGAIQAAAKKYGVDPAEVKLKIGMESGGNPKAVNAQTGATGLGQFMPATAQRYGVADRTNPEQSIDGIARMLADTGSQAGGDRSKVDRAYYGGNVSAKGPNTDQYVENARAVRSSLVGSGSMPQLSSAQLEYAEEAVLDRARTLAEQRKPGDTLYRDQVVTAARSNWSKAVQAQRGQDYGNFSTVLGATIKTGATSPSDLPVEAQGILAKLTPQNYLSIQTQFDRNVKAANGEYSKSDPKVVNDLRQRIYLPDGDPGKITHPGQLTPYMTDVNHADFEHLRTEMAQANTPEGNPFLKQVNGVKETGRKMLTGSMSAIAIAHPELADEAAYRFSADLDNKVKAARAAGVDPQTLFVPGSKDYVLDPSRVSSFMPTEAQVAALKVRALELAKRPAQVSAAVPRLPNESPAAYLQRIGK